MANSTIGRLLVEIGLDSSKFNPELKKIQNNIKSLEKDLKNMDKEFGDVGKSITGLEKKSQLLNKVLSENGKAMNEHIKQRDAYAEMLRTEKEELDTLYSAQERDEKAILQKEKSIQSLINKYQKEENAINKIASIQANYQKQLDEVSEQYNRLVNNIETYDERLENISKSTSLTNSELKAQQNILEASGKKFQAYNKQAEIIENSLKGAIETYQEHRKELSKNESEISKLTQTSEEHRKQLSKQESVLESIREYYGENSIEYEQQANLVERLTKRQIEYEQSLASTIEHSDEVRRSLAQSKEEVTEYYKSLKEVGSTKLTRNLKMTSETLSSVADATKGASAVGLAVGSGSTAIFMGYESGLAKLSTLTSKSKGEMELIGRDIIKISNETGTSIEEMMEGAYQAVSAGVELGNLNDFLATSSKLATSGFTDMASATKVLSQIMNNYGADAYTAEEAASMLMKTQNLGVTTVAELSQEMSESLSLASTFGMNFENIATAFAKMTKAGTSTSEAGTAIARMLEELGDTGSNVSQILKEKTGKSFTELAQEGNSLFDILTTLQKHADATGVSMTELWGSSNAGVGALQILSSEGGTFNEMLQEISSSSGLLDESFGKMSDTSAFKLQSALNELKNSFIEIGGALAPFISEFSNAISGVAKFIDGLGDSTKTTIGYVSGIIAVLSPLIGVTSKVFGGISNMFANLKILGIDPAKKFIESMVSELKESSVISQAVEGTVNGAIESVKVNKGASKQIVDEFGNVLSSGIKDGMDDLGKTASKSSGIFKSLWSVMKAHPYVAITAGVLTLAAAMKKGYDIYKDYQKVQNTKHQTALKEIQEETKAHEEKVKAHESELETIEGLSSRYNELSGKQKLTKEQEEERLGILKQIAELDPSLVEYDESGNPIRIKNEELKEYIENLKDAIEQEGVLARQGYRDQAKENAPALEEKKKGYEEDKTNIQDKINKMKENKTQYVDRDEKIEIPGFLSIDWVEDTSTETKKKDIQRYLDLVNEEAEMIKKYAKDRQSASDINRGAIESEVQARGLLNDVAEESKTAYQHFMSTMDFSELDVSQITSMTTTLGDFFATCSEADRIKMDNFVSEVGSLNQNFKNGSIDAPAYEQALDGIAQQIASLTGLDVETVKNMIKCPEFDSESALKTSSDIDTAKANILSKLLEMENLDPDLRIDYATTLVNNTDIPIELRSQIAEAMADGKITDEEYNAIVKALVELDTEIEDDIDGVDAEVKTVLEKNIKNQNLNVEVAITIADMYVHDLRSLVDYVKGTSLDKEAKVTVETALAEKNLETVAEKVKELPTEQQCGIVVAMQQSGEYTPEELQGFIDNLPEEVKSQLKVAVENGQLPQEIARDLGLIPEETKSEVTITADNSDVEKKKQENKKPTQSTHKTNSDNSSVTKDKSSNKQPTNSTHKTNSDNSAVNRDKSNNKQPTNSNHKFKGDNSDVRAKMKENQKNTSSTHTINVIQKITQTVSNLFGGGKKNNSGGKTGAVKDPIIVPMTIQAQAKPIVVNDFSSTLSQAQATIQSDANAFANARNNAVATIQATSFTDTIVNGLGWVDSSIDYDIDLLQDFSAQLNRLGNELEAVSQKAELAFGSSKANLLQNEISLLQQKQQMLAHEKNEYIAMNENLKSMLSQQGFRVDGNGAVTNYANRLLELEKAVERAKDAQDAYEGDDKNRQKSLQDAYDNANERLQKAKDTLSEYYDTSSKIGDTEKEWYDVQQAIRDTKNEIYETNREARNFYTDAHIKELEYAYEDLGNKIDLINSKMELGNNHEKISLLQDELVLLERQQQKNNELMNSYKQQQQYFKEFLQNRGFSFDYLGDIVNAEDKLAQYRTSDEYESIIDAYEQYMEIQSSTLPDLVNEWVDLENEQQDVKETIEEVQKEIKELNKMKTFDFLDELIDKQEKLENQLNILSSKMEVTYGSNKEQLLREQIGLLNQQQLALSNVNNELERQRQYLVMDMKQDGFTFDTSGNISNLDYLLSIAETQDKYNELKEKAEEYQDIQNEITSNNAEWHNLQSEIRDTQDEIQNLQQELREMVYESNLRQLTNEFTVLQNQLDKLENKLELNGTDASEIYKEQLKLIEKQKEATEKQIKYQQEKAKELNGTLISYGFIINDDGTIENTTQRLESLKNQLSDDEFSRVNNFLEEYFEIALEEIPNLENQMLSLQKSIEDIEEEKLDKAKQIEDEITKVYEKQIEERIKAIEKERDAQVESLNKQKDAYSKWRAEIDYEEDYNEQLSKVQELQSQIDIAKKDDSLSGKKRLEDLMKQLTEEQKNLEGIVQDRTDTLINQMIDDQIENIEDRADEQIKGIEDVFNETKLSEMVANAMQTGIFEDIDGNISELDNALMEFANNSTDYLGVMGEGLKNELLDNLNVALDYMQQMEKISLDMSKIEYDTARYVGVGYQKGVIEGVISSNTTNNNDNRVINVSFNPQIEVAGGGTVDETQIMGIMDKAKSDLINEIQHQILNNMK